MAHGGLGLQGLGSSWHLSGLSPGGDDGEITVVLQCSQTLNPKLRRY